MASSVHGISHTATIDWVKTIPPSPQNIPSAARQVENAGKPPPSSGRDGKTCSSDASVRRVDLPSPVPATNSPPPAPIPSPVPPASDAPAPAPAPAPTPAPAARSRWSQEDEVALLNTLRRHLRRNDDLPRGVDLVMAVFGRLKRTDFSLAEIEDKIRSLRKQFEDNDAMLCAGTGSPAAGHDLRLYTLSLEVWGTAPTNIAAPKRDLEEPAQTAPAVKDPAARVPARRYNVPWKRSRCEEMREKYPELAKEVQKQMWKAFEGINDMTAWSLEMRLKNKQLPGCVPAGPAEDRTKELTSLITNLF